MALEREMTHYKEVLPTLLEKEGDYVVICDSKVIGVFESYADALEAGYEECGLEPFLVKRISVVESLAYFNRDINIQCRT